ncbi:FAD-dependent oxidoreductase [Streptomyces sp. BH055]|uniref:FAD-dependent oxidoreductase n=1 Tax=Streptomyces sp. BH055 TaxID=3401173 RepID=UPI003BB63311
MVEKYPFLGGAATISSVLSLCGIFDRRGEKVVAGVADQLLDRLHEHGAYREKSMGSSGNRIVLLDAETTKLAYDEVTAAAGVDVRLHSTLIGAKRSTAAAAAETRTTTNSAPAVASWQPISSTGRGLSPSRPPPPSPEATTAPSAAAAQSVTLNAPTAHLDCR